MPTIGGEADVLLLHGGVDVHAIALRGRDNLEREPGADALLQIDQTTSESNSPPDHDGLDSLLSAWLKYPNVLPLNGQIG
jgi:hypothetical protein